MGATARRRAHSREELQKKTKKTNNVCLRRGDINHEAAVKVSPNPPPRVCCRKKSASACYRRLSLSEGVEIEPGGCDESVVHTTQHTHTQLTCSVRECFRRTCAPARAVISKGRFPSLLHASFPLFSPSHDLARNDESEKRQKNYLAPPPAPA